MEPCPFDQLIDPPSKQIDHEAISAAYLAAIVESSDDAIVSKDLNGIVKSWNRGAERIFGYSAEEAIGKSILLIIPEERRSEEDMILSRLRSGEKVEHFQTVRRRKDGSEIHVSVSVSPIRDSNGTIVGASKIARDLSEQIAGEAANARLAAIIESSDDAIVSKSLEGIVQSWNKGAERLFGYLAEEMIGKPIEIILPPDRKDEEASILQRLRSGERVDHFETVRIRKDGRLVHVSVTISPIQDRTGRIIGASKVARDISERKVFEATAAALTLQLEQRVRERTAELQMAHEEMESFTYSIAHDIRAPLRAIVSNSRILIEDFGDSIPEGAVQLLERQALSAKHLAKLVDDLLNYARLGRSSLKVVEFDFTKLAEEAASKVEKQCHTVVVEPGLTARGDRAMLSLLLYNLLDNSCKYSPEGGEVVIGKTDNVFFIRDQGMGFDMAYADKIFQPFERLVGNQKIIGSGIGLASAKRIVEKHGGAIWASSTPGQGATIYFTLCTNL